MRFEQLLHETIDEMAGELHAPAAGLAARSMVKGRRIRRTRRLAAAGTAVVAVVAVVVSWTAVSRPDATAPPPVPAVSTSPIAPTALVASGVLPGGWVVTGAGYQALDRATGEFVIMQGPMLPAPTGNRILIIDGPESVRLTDVRGTNPVTVDTSGLVGDYSWSPAGDRLTGGVSQKEPFKIGFAIIDARTGTVRKQWIDADRYDCSQCSFTWTRDGTEVVMPIADRSGGEAEERVASLQLFNADTGAPTRSLPVTAMPSGPFSWSPDGRYVLAGPPGTSLGWRRFDLTTGQSQPFPKDAMWVSNDVLLAPQDGKVLSLKPDGTTTATIDVGAPGRGLITLGPPG
ncbi:hypothetical protein OHA72_56075 [Dactylosporangium sp. NBC_01737]|uniref:TolB family protein n=1 Tax=Dactylosporangium sp. NBC_01737 TaxID=2975959 RepID=UPI002E162FFF|nr:hypothetical protein OHA72_56075 [Dactylosporangium sp. NBC_01737]